MPTSRKTSPRIWQQTYLLNRALVGEIDRQVQRLFPQGWDGTIVDVGCGDMPYRELFEGRYGRYVGCDYYSKREDVVKCPADDLSLPDESADAVVCFQVLEHLQRPWRAIAECARILRPGAPLLLTTPFVFPHHSSPHDFYRYTHEGLRFLVEDAGLEVEEITAQCGSLATLVLFAAWYNEKVARQLRRRSFTRPLAWLVQGAQVPLNGVGLALDQIKAARRFDVGNMGVSNYAVVARKPS